MCGKDSVYRMRDGAEIKKESTSSRNLELEKELGAIYNSWRYGGTVGFLKRRWRLRSLSWAANWKQGPKVLGK